MDLTHDVLLRVLAPARARAPRGPAPRRSRPAALPARARHRRIPRPPWGDVAVVGALLLALLA